MSEPRMACVSCGRVRNCLLHLRAEHSPTAARRWLEKHCAHDEEMCDIHYQAGIELGRLSLEGQTQRLIQEEPHE